MGRERLQQKIFAEVTPAQVSLRYEKKNAQKLRDTGG